MSSGPLIVAMVRAPVETRYSAAIRPPIRLSTSTYCSSPSEENGRPTNAAGRPERAIRSVRWSSRWWETTTTPSTWSPSR